MVSKGFISVVLTATLVVLFSSVSVKSQDEEAARVVPLPTCPKPGLCPYVKRIVPDFLPRPTIYTHTPAVHHYPSPPHHPAPYHQPPHHQPPHYQPPHQQVPHQQVPHQPVSHYPTYVSGVHYGQGHQPIVAHPNNHYTASHVPATGVNHGSSYGYAHGSPHGSYAEGHHVEKRDQASHYPHHIEASICGNLCTNDNACPGYKKCCPTECGYSCFDPIHLIE